MYQNKGLQYRIVDEHGNRVGVPIKASNFYQKPTLKYLEERFNLNQAAWEPHQTRVKNAVDLAFFRQANTSLAGLGLMEASKGKVSTSSCNGMKLAEFMALPTWITAPNVCTTAATWVKRIVLMGFRKGVVSSSRLPKNRARSKGKRMPHPPVVAQRPELKTFRQPVAGRATAIRYYAHSGRNKAGARKIIWLRPSRCRKIKLLPGSTNGPGYR